MTHHCAALPRPRVPFWNKKDTGWGGPVCVPAFSLECSASPMAPYCMAGHSCMGALPLVRGNTPLAILFSIPFLMNSSLPTCLLLLKLGLHPEIFFALAHIILWVFKLKHLVAHSSCWGQFWCTSQFCLVFTTMNSLMSPANFYWLPLTPKSIPLYHS